MMSTDTDLHSLQEARRRSAEKVRLLLQELEVAEKEFEELTEKLRIVANVLPAERTSPEQAALTR